MAMETELLVIGAGPAGLSAAAKAAKLGVETILVDEHRAPGGMLALLGTTSARDGAATDGGLRQTLLAEAQSAGATLLSQALAWGIFEDLLTGVLTPAESLEITPRALIVAAGATDRPMPSPGWTLPYVLNAQEALRLVYEQDALPGRTAVVASCGGAGVPVALALQAGGVRVAALAEYASLEAEEREALAAAGIAAHELARVAEARGTEYVRAVVLQTADGLRTVDANTLVFATGRAPLIELFAVTGCALRWEPSLGGHVPERSRHLETSVEGLYAIGASAGLCGPRVAVAEGRVAAAAAAVRVRPNADTRARLDAALRDLEAARAADDPAIRREVDTLWQAETDAVALALRSPDLHLCRCEKVTVASIREAIEHGAKTPGEVKRATRMGMGECQGKNCRPLLSRAVALVTGGELAAVPPLTFRPPVRPVPLDALLRGSE
jgi:thioredoxin reductase/bacterioferritin-associated ferredoxin